MEQARRSALAHHVHRTAPMGPRVLINGIWYNSAARPYSGPCFTPPIALPIGALSWIAITILCLYVLLFTDPSSSRQRGALILLATTVPMLWSHLLFRYFANFILEIDASLIGLLLRTGHTGNIVAFADQSGSHVIAPGCSSLANVSLAFVTWVTISQWPSHRWSFKDLSWCFLAAVPVIVINVTRTSLMGLSEMHYHEIAPELTGHGLPLSKCEAYNRVYDQFYRSR